MTEPVKITKDNVEAELKKLKLTAEDTKVLGTMSVEEKIFFVKQSEVARRMIISEMSQAVVDQKLVDEIDFRKDLFSDEEGHSFNLGEFLFRKGQEVVLQFLGLRYIFSKNEKEYWEKVVSEDGSNEAYRSEVLEFRNTKGEIIRLYPTRMLKNQLRNMLTFTSGSREVTGDPQITLTYDGFQPKDVLKSVYKFETDEPKAHATTIKYDRNTVKFGTGRGCLNPLNSPKLPNLRQYDEDMDSADITAQNFEALQAEAMNNTPALEGEATEQITQ
jgi:hypothetical protein